MNRSPIQFAIPKLIFRDGLRCLPITQQGALEGEALPSCRASQLAQVCAGFSAKWLDNIFNIFAAENVHRSLIDSPSWSTGGGLGFLRLVDLSPSEIEWLHGASLVNVGEAGVVVHRLLTLWKTCCSVGCISRRW